MRFAFLLPAFAFLAGCSGARFAVPDVEQLPDVAFVRPPDGLLGRPDLMEIVDLQVMRRGYDLLSYLSHPDAAVRARAAFALGSVQFHGAGPELLNLLHDASPNVRADAAFAIGQTADSTAGFALLDALQAETDPNVQTELVEALGKVGDLPSLLGLLNVDVLDAAENARDLAIARYGLRDIHHPEAVAHLLSHEPMTEAAAYYFGRIRDTDVWAEQADNLRRARQGMSLGDPAIMHLMAAFGRLGVEQDYATIAGTLTSDPDWRNRNNAARAIGMLEDRAPHFQSDLLRALADENPNVAQTAAEVLAAFEEPTPELVRSLVENEWLPVDGPRASVAATLLPVLVRGGRVDDVMAWLAAQNSPFMQAQGLSALGGAQDDASLNLLFDEANDEDTRVAYAALEALKERWGSTRDTADAARFYTTFAAGVARRDLATTSASASILTDSLFTPFDPGSDLRAVYLQMEAPADIEPMVEIVKALAEIRDGQEIDFLVDVVMQSGHTVLRQAAEEALNGRLEEGIDAELRGETLTSTVLIDWEQLADYGPRPLLTLFTARGPVVIEMDAEQAPQTVQKIIRTAVLGDYDGVPFHRVVPNFVIQGGDYFREDGFGGPDVAIRSEFTRIPYTTGTAGMASSGKDTEGVQFFVTHSMQPHLDGRYTAFGRVVHGQDVVDVIQQGDVVVRAQIERSENR